MIDMRDAYFDVLYSIGEQNNNVIILTNDMDVFSLLEFKKNFPEQFINIGVAEQNMINVAAGLAESGKHVFVYGIASFVIYRCFEQIKFNICSMNLPVTLIGVGTGLSFSFDGPTHHGMQDIGTVRMLPEMEIYSPCDAFSAAQSCTTSNRNPRYVRIEKGPLPDFYTDGDGWWKQLRSYSKENCVLTTGYMTHKAVEVADKLKKFSVFDVCKLCPLPEDLLFELSKFRKIVCFEEHSVIGGLGAILAESANEWANTNLKRVGLPHCQFLEYGSRQWFHETRGLITELEKCFLK